MGMVRMVAISVLLVGVAVTALVFGRRVLPRETGVQALPVAPLEHAPGPRVMATPGTAPIPHSISTRARRSGRVQVVLPSLGSTPPAVDPQTHVSKPVTRTKPRAPKPVAPHKQAKPPTRSPSPKPPAPVVAPATTPVATPGPTASPAPPTREPASSVPPTTTTPTPPVAPPPPPVTPPPVDSRPGNGYGDDNHDHTGPPGQSKDGGGHDDSNGNGNHGNSNKHGG